MAYKDSKEIISKIVEILTEQLYVKTQMFYHRNDFVFVITGKRDYLLPVPGAMGGY